MRLTTIALIASLAASPALADPTPTQLPSAEDAACAAIGGALIASLGASAAGFALIGLCIAVSPDGWLAQQVGRE